MEIMNSESTNKDRFEETRTYPAGSRMTLEEPTGFEKKLNWWKKKKQILEPDRIPNQTRIKNKRWNRLSKIKDGDILSGKEEPPGDFRKQSAYC